MTVTLYFFYAGWCPCSHASAPWIKKALADNAGAGLQAFGVGIQDKTAKLTEFARLHKLDFPVAVQGGQALADQTGVAITPTTLFVDENGVIKSVFVGKIERWFAF